MKRKKTLPPTYMFFALTVLAGLYFLFPDCETLKFPWNLMGIAPLIFGIFLNLIADKAFTKNKTTVKPFEESTTLITDGAFRICRHPMYLGMTMILLGLALLLGKLSPLIVPFIFALLMEMLFIRTEEQMLEEKFGDSWREYKNKVRRWI